MIMPPHLFQGKRNCDELSEQEFDLVEKVDLSVILVRFLRKDMQESLKAFLWSDFKNQFKINSGFLHKA